jgi:hypothetical protein
LKILGLCGQRRISRPNSTKWDTSIAPRGLVDPEWFEPRPAQLSQVGRPHLDLHICSELAGLRQPEMS